LYLVADLVLVLAVVVTVLVWQVEVAVTLLRCSMLTATTSLQVPPSTPFVLDLLADVLAAVVATVEQDVVSMDVLRSFLVVDLVHSVCRVVLTPLIDAPTAAIPA
jgi:hypothetical protein